MSRGKHTRPEFRGESANVTPVSRIDGELYGAPEPNPFTSAWRKGYADGFEKEPYSFEGLKVDILRYEDGYNCGQQELKEMDRLGSSNA